MSFLHRLPLLLAALFTLGPVVAQDQKATPKQAAQDKAAARDDAAAERQIGRAHV